MGGIYEACRWDSLRRRDTSTAISDDQYRNSFNMKVIWQTTMFVLVMGRTQEVCYWGGWMYHVCVPSFVKTGKCFQAILRFCLKKCEAAITRKLLQTGRIYELRRWGGRDFRITPWVGFMWHDIQAKFHEDWYRHSSYIEVLSQQFEKL
jgi:hypothetical protein